MKRTSAAAVPDAARGEAQVLVLSAAGGRDEIASAFASAGHDVTVADTAAGAASRLAQPGIAFVALDLAARDALRFLHGHAGLQPRVPVVCIADPRRPEASCAALRLGVADVIARPLREWDVASALANARELARLAARAVGAPDAPPAVSGIFAASPAMRDVLQIVRRVAPSRCAVLVVGERDTGREMIARAIHESGAAHDAPLLKILCVDGRSHEFEQVMNGGVPPGATVYFDELTELPADAQARLEIRLRADAAAAAKGAVPVRFIAGVPPNLADIVAAGGCRSALVEALAVVRIVLPPLRQRRQDVPMLAMHFLKEACRLGRVPAKTFSRGALTLLSSMPWVGNAGELRSLCERLAVLVPRGVVLLEDVLENVRLDGAEAIGRATLPLKEARERFERDYVTSVLQHHRGRVGVAARALGVERTNLYRKIKQLNIRWTLPGSV